MKEILVTSTDLVKYMGSENYKKFIIEVQKKLKLKGVIWIVAQVLEKKDCFWKKEI